MKLFIYVKQEFGKIVIITVARSFLNYDQFSNHSCSVVEFLLSFKWIQNIEFWLINYNKLFLCVFSVDRMTVNRLFSITSQRVQSSHKYSYFQINSIEGLNDSMIEILSLVFRLQIIFLHFARNYLRLLIPKCSGSD